MAASIANWIPADRASQRRITKAAKAATTRKAAMYIVAFRARSESSADQMPDQVKRGNASLIFAQFTDISNPGAGEGGSSSGIVPRV